MKKNCGSILILMLLSNIILDQKIIQITFKDSTSKKTIEDVFLKNACNADVSISNSDGSVYITKNNNGNYLLDIVHRKNFAHGD